jgi:hypothetical protein
MVTPVLFFPNNVVPTTGTAYNDITSGAWSTLLGVKQIASAIGATISGLQAYSSAAVAANYYTISLNVNGVATALKCSIGQPGGANPGTTTACSDSVDAVTINPGDLVAIQSDVPAGAPTGATLYFSMLLTATASGGQESFVGAGGQGLPTTSINFGSLSGAPANATENLVSVIMPTAGTLDQFRGSLFATPTSGKGFGLTIFKNGVATPFSFTCISSNVCNDLTDSVSVVAGDTLSLQMCPTNTAGCPAGTAPAAGNIIGYSMRWVPSVAKQALMLSVPAPAPATLTSNYYSALANAINYTNTESAQRNIAPTLSTTMTLGNLWVSQCPGPDSTGAGGVSRPVTLRVNGVSQAPTVTLPGTAINACPTMTTQHDSAHTATAATAGLVNFLTSINTTTNAAAGTVFKSSMTATVP